MKQLHYYRCFSISDSSSCTKLPTTGSDCTADADAITAATVSATKTQQPCPIFPWHHETLNNPLPRLSPGTPEFLNDIIFAHRGQAFLACLFLNMPFWQIFVGHKHWRHDLADASGWAFAQGVAGILSNVYSVEQLTAQQAQQQAQQQGQ